MPTMPDYSITVDAHGVTALLDMMGEEIAPRILVELAEVSELTVESMKEHAPVGATEELRDSIGYEINPDLFMSEIKPTADYGDAVETGSKPHWAPIEPLKLWADLKGINPYALRWSIAQKGTMPHPYIKPTYEEMAPVIGDRFAAGIASFIAETEAVAV
jgi:hypothetical protein